MAAQCVVDLCDTCIVDITETKHPDDTSTSYRIEHPPAHIQESGSQSTTEAPGHALRMRFSRRFSPGSIDETAADNTSTIVRGVARFAWYNRTPTAADRLMLGLLVDNALHLIGWQLSEQYARAARVRVENISIALQTSREIGAAVGILMSLHKVTSAQAFDILRVASQRSNRKLHYLALEVVDTGWLDPALTATAGALDH